MNRWLVEYTSGSEFTQQLVIYCTEKSEVRKILKKHLQGARFHIIRIVRYEK